MSKPYYEKTFLRHKKDLADVASGKKPNLRFNKKLGFAYIAIIEQLKHYKGEWAGTYIKLEDWQKKVVMIAFGWEKLNSKGEWVRRFNTVFFFLPRKNGKTILVSGISIADSIVRGEQGGEVVFFATKRSQAKLAWDGTEKMLTSNKELKEYVKEAYSKLTFTKNETTFSTLGRDSETEDGLNVTVGVADEHHAHPDDRLWDVVKSSQGARKQPLMMSITTAGFHIESPAYNLYIYAKQILDGVIEDDNFFAFIAEARAKDDPFDESTWEDANPNYGISISKDEFAQAAKEAKERPEKLNNFLVKRLNRWTNAAQSYLPYDKWMDCAGDMVPFETNIIGEDLSITDDFSSSVFVYEKNGYIYLNPKFYIPKNRIYERERELRVPLSAWVRDGYITATHGDSIDYDFICADIEKQLPTCEAFCYDPYKAGVIVNKLEKEFGFDSCIPIRQGFLTLSTPTKYFLDLVRDGKIIHPNNPVFNWMISNLSILTDASGNIKPNKSRPNAKIDGPAAFINVLAYLISSKTEEITSVYEERGIRYI
ncbi:MAG: terminase large subunit [Epsilonproteobacteria bacterium]|nr:terminase large subunit [Campylobacterota bacterium]